MTDATAGEPLTDLPTTTPAKPTKPPRVWFVDILRLIASAQMINGHTLDAVMVASIRQGPSYDRYVWCRGLVSVSFMVVAGMAYHISTLARYERHKANPDAVKRRVRRAVIIILCGYLVNFPFGALAHDPGARELSWFYFRRIGVLQCIGTSLLVLELMTIFSRRVRHVVIASAVLAALCIVFAPRADAVIADLDGSHMLLNWLSHQGGSQFPLLPWAGYVLAGVALGAWAMPAAGHTPLGTVLRRLLVASAVSAACLAMAHHIPIDLHDPAIHHAFTEPTLCMERLTSVVFVVLFLAIVSKPIAELPRFLRVMSSETLTIYGFHIVVLFWPYVTIARRFDRNLPLPQAFGVVAFMFVVTCSFAWWWHHFKARGYRLRARQT